MFHCQKKDQLVQRSSIFSNLEKYMESCMQLHIKHCKNYRIIIITLYRPWYFRLKVVAGYDESNPIFTFLQQLKPGVMQYKRITSKVTMKDLKSHFTEAKLVQLLEQHGIGRPSTFASLIDKIQERGYVKKTNVTGKKVKCVDFELVEDVLEEKADEREFGGEKGKLVIQQLGVVVMEFLLQHYDIIYIRLYQIYGR